MTLIGVTNLRSFSYAQSKANAACQRIDGIRYPRYVRSSFLLFAAYLAVPVLDVPFFGLSLSAILIIPVADWVSMRGRPGLRSKYYNPHRALLSLMVGSIIFSALVGALVSGIGDLNVVLNNVIRFSYWGFVAHITMRIIMETDLDGLLVIWIQRGIKLLTILLLVALLGGREVLTPNAFAIQMTMFAPFMLPGLLQRGSSMFVSGLWFIVIWGAAFMNGSRQGMLMLAIQSAAFLLLISLFSKYRSQYVMVVLLCLAGAYIGVLGSLKYAPDEVLEHINRKLYAAENLDMDKSWQIRLIKNQHALKVFGRYPITGVGAGGMRETEVELNLPTHMSYADNEHFLRKSSHNSHLQILAEGGLMAFIPWVMLILTLLFSGYKFLPGEIREQRYFLLCAYLSFTGMVIQFWVIAGHTGTAPFFLFGCLSGAILKARQRQRVENMQLRLTN